MKVDAMPNNPLVADWDLIHRWEWFRRSCWREGFRSALHGQGGGVTRAFADLAHLVGAEVLLDASCGLGRRVIALTEKGYNTVGSDRSGVAVLRAQELARDENSPATFFRSSWNTLPRNIPHHFDAILAPGLEMEPTFDRLGTAFVGLFHSLKPGGFVMWTGAGEQDAQDDSGKKRLAHVKCEPAERVEWFHREGKLTCALLKQYKVEADFIDERRLYISEEGGAANLETTVIRWPGYWHWTHWQDLTRMAGFEHVETRVYEHFGLDGGPLPVNVTWKAKDASSSGEFMPEARAGEEAYH